MPTSPQALYGRDPRELPAYSVGQVSAYLRMPISTLRSWALGRDYTTGAGRQHWSSLIKTADPVHHRLSFINVVELFVLDSLRRRYELKMPKIRAAIEYLRREMGQEHPLASERMLQTDGCDLFVDRLGSLVNISRHGQLAMRDVLLRYLTRIDYGPSGAVGLYPFVRTDPGADDPKIVMINPLFGFGQPVLARTNIRTEIIGERFGAGESILELAEDYDRETREIEEAIRYESWRQRHQAAA